MSKQGQCLSTFYFKSFQRTSRWHQLHVKKAELESKNDNFGIIKVLNYRLTVCHTLEELFILMNLLTLVASSLVKIALVKVLSRATIEFITAFMSTVSFSYIGYIK